MDELVDQQSECRSRISRANENLRKLGTANITQGAIESRLKALRNKWEQFEKMHAKLLSIRTRETANHLYFTSNIYDETEEIFLTQETKFLDHLKSLQPSTTTSTNAAELKVSEVQHRRQLPRIDLPKFSGKYSDWTQFRDMFVALVQTDNNISAVEKMHYLKMSLSGEPALLLKNLPVTGENFTKAWGLLTKQYENERLLISSHLSTLFSLRSVASETVAELKRLVNNTTDAIGALESLNRPVEHWDDILVYLTVQKLDSQSRRDWETSIGVSLRPSTFEELKMFLDTRIRALEALEHSSKPSSQTASSGKPSHVSNSQSTKSSTSSVKVHHASRKQPSSPSQCSFCQQSHFIVYCAAFRAKSVVERRDFVTSNNLCFNCLGSHFINECRSSKLCRTCNGRHHTMLHNTASPLEHNNTISTIQQHDTLTSVPSGSGNSVPSSGASEAKQSSHSSTITTHATQCNSPPLEHVLLATARIQVASSSGEYSTARALIDPCSQASFISESLTQRLRLQRRSASVPIIGVGHAPSNTSRGIVSLVISSRTTSRFTCQVEALVLPILTAYTPPLRKKTQGWPHIQGIMMADPHFTKNDPIDVLLGADVYTLIIEEGLRKGHVGCPVAQQTTLGWILTGPTFTSSNTVTMTQPCSQNSFIMNPVTSLQCSVDLSLPQLLQRFWEQEEVTLSSEPTLTHDESQCEDHFRSTHQRDATGRYIVRLPMKAQITDLGDSKTPANAALRRLERRFQTDTQLQDAYVAFMDEYESLNHMKKVSDTSNQSEPSSCFYLPHHGVVKASSTTTKLRVVFNGSQKTERGTSLNSYLHIGPKLQPDLADILSRWRMFPIAFAADIEKMYRQIRIHPDDYDLQRILWRKTTGEPISTYQLQTVTYGLASAPYLALRTIKQLSQDESAKFPAAAKSLSRNIYVDDVLAGADTLEAANSLKQELLNLLKAGGFPLKKWTSNCPQFLHTLPPDWIASTSSRSWQSEAEYHTLGLTWQPASDTFTFHVSASDVSRKLTKRSVLSQIAKLFDPLGWLTPVTVTSKIFMQKLWLLEIGWDDPLPEKQQLQWTNYHNELRFLNSIRIPRWLGYSENLRITELHGFSDASEQAYSAVVYLRTVSFTGITKMSMISAKTKVAPLKTVSIPRLELCGATLLCKLTQSTCRTLSLESVPIHLWSDSTVVTSWIQSHPTRWKTYVANRVSTIQTSLPQAHWHHINGKENPADCASRGISAVELSSFDLWWSGPPWLSCTSSQWNPSSSTPELEECPDQRVTTHHTHVDTTSEWDLLQRFSSLQKLVRVTAWCRRFIVQLQWARTSTRRPRPAAALSPDPLTTTELNEARLFWVRHVQQAAFSSEIRTIRMNQPLPKKSTLIRFAPCLDEHGLLRVGGRLAHSLLEPEEKHPLILPRDSPLTGLIIDQCHRRVLHGGTQLTLSTLRRTYWILGGRSAVKGHIYRCTRCVRFRATTAHQRMGDLPRNRTLQARAFLHSGVDYAGPIHLRMSKGRGHRSYPAYIAVFVCFVTRAVHLEVVSDYTTDGFLAAFHRFTARRGICATLTSDCGTNFIGADAKLRSLFNSASQTSREIAQHLANDGTQWKFNPPAAPHFGGLFEAAVKSVKHHLKRVIGDSTLTYEEMSTFLAQTEACLNSRPLQPMSDDPSDLSALTPGHFLIGSALTTVPEPSLLETNIHRLSRWQLIRRMAEQFWQRWSTEYLQSLQTRSKWHQPQPQVQVGDLCLLKTETLPPSKWALARVLEVHPGPDGNVRVVTIRTATSTFKRPIVKLCPLPTSQRTNNA